MKENYFKIELKMNKNLHKEFSQFPVPGPDSEEHFEGLLTRKHEWESTTKRAGNRLVCLAVCQEKKNGE